eukprot:356981-Chlamydomonas_euryale.AAC.4
MALRCKAPFTCSGGDGHFLGDPLQGIAHGAWRGTARRRAGPADGNAMQLRDCPWCLDDSPFYCRRGGAIPLTMTPSCRMVCQWCCCAGGVDTLAWVAGRDG